MSERVCGYAVIDVDGTEEPCDRPAPYWRWYQDCEHEDMLDVACDWHANEGGRRMAAVQALVDEWQRELDTGAIRDSNARYCWSTAARELRAALGDPR